MQTHNLIQGSDEWATFRLSHHGASEAAVMLGLSKKTTRSELLRMKHTSLPKEFSAWVQANILDYGHEVEALARPLVEQIIGDDLYPVTASNEDDGGRLSASCDGLTLFGDTAFEHKQWATELAASVESGMLPDEHMPQCQQIMLVTGAQRVIFVVSDGTTENMVWMEVLPDQAWFERIRAGWAQFEKDLATYTPPEIVDAPLAAQVPTLLNPKFAVAGELSIVSNNLPAFKVELEHFIAGINTDPVTDQDFADAEATKKRCEEIETLIVAAKAGVSAQVFDIDAALRLLGDAHESIRANRLALERKIDSKKKAIKDGLQIEARKKWAEHIASLEDGIAPIRLFVPAPAFADAAKNKRTLESLRNAIDTALANGKIAADQQAADLYAKLAWLNVSAAGYRHLLADLQQLVTKPVDDFKLAVSARIDAHKKAEAARLEIEREQILQEFSQQASEPAPTAGPTTVVTVLAPCPSAIEPHSTAPAGAPMLRLGQINELLAPVTLTADGLLQFGFVPSAKDKAAKLYRESDFPHICAALMRHIHAAQSSRAVQLACTCKSRRTSHAENLHCASAIQRRAICAHSSGAGFVEPGGCHRL